MTMAGSGSIFYYFAFGLPGLVFGLLCFFLADWIVKLAYGMHRDQR